MPARYFATTLCLGLLANSYAVEWTEDLGVGSASLCSVNGYAENPSCHYTRQPTNADEPHVVKHGYNDYEIMPGPYYCMKKVSGGGNSGHVWEYGKINGEKIRCEYAEHCCASDEAIAANEFYYNGNKVFCANGNDPGGWTGTELRPAGYYVNGQPSESAFLQARGFATKCKAFTGVTFSGADPMTSLDDELATRFYCRDGVLTHMYSDDKVASIQYVVSGLEADARVDVAEGPLRGDWVKTFNVTFRGAPNAPLVVKVVDEPAKKLSSDNGISSLRLPGEPLATLQVFVGDKPLLTGLHSPIASLPKLRVGMSSGTKRIGNAYVEKVDIKLPGVALRVSSAKAAKFNSEEMQLRGLHLDIQYIKFDRAAARGPLAEMWGLRTMTNATRAMLVPPRTVV